MKKWAEQTFMCRASELESDFCRHFLRQAAASVTENRFCSHSETDIKAQELLKSIR